MSEKLRQLIDGEITRADSALAASKVLLEKELLDDAVSRAYYASLHAAKAALLSKGIETSSHRGVLSMFGLHLVKSGDIEIEYAKMLAVEKEDREIGDYDITVEISEERAEERVEEAEKFVERIKRFLKHV